MGRNTFLAVALLAVFTFGFFPVASVQGQLVLTDIKAKIVKVDRVKHRLEIRVHEGGNQNIQYVLIDGHTKFSTRNRLISQARAWSLLRHGMIIRVKGGLQFDLKIKAKYIYW